TWKRPTTGPSTMVNELVRIARPRAIGPFPRAGQRRATRTPAVYDCGRATHCTPHPRRRTHRRRECAVLSGSEGVGDARTPRAPRGTEAGATSVADPSPGRGGPGAESPGHRVPSPGRTLGDGRTSRRAAARSPRGARAPDRGVSILWHGHRTRRAP